ncbi:MAG: hypothetical protein JXQ72_02565 [Anaerolineae bacterium]|nr:hypothetical protein [Anaerolineae bacterium]
MRAAPLIKQTRFPLGSMITVGVLPAALKRAYYRLRGHKIGRGVEIGMGSVIVGKTITIGEGTKIGFGTIIMGRHIEIGRYVSIGAMSYLNANKIFIDDDARINNQVFAGGIEFPDSELSLGKRTIVMEHTFLNPTRPLRIGDDTGIGGKCSIFTHGSWQNQLEGFPVTFAPVTLGNNVWIPWDVFIMPGVTIGDNATIGAGSLVRKNVPAGAVAAGVPAKVLQTGEDRPGRPEDKTRRELVRGYLDAFGEFVQFYGIEIRDSQAITGGTIYRYRQNGQIHAIYFAESSMDWAAVLAQHPAMAAAIVTLAPLSESQQQVITARGHMWLDLDTRQRGGVSTSIGEQVAWFLSRYGVRFADVV